VKAAAVGGGIKAVFVIDSEGREVGTAVSEISRHFKELKDRFRVVVVVPRHEAWLCIGLGFDAARCRNSPEHVLSMERGRYEKRHLAEWVREIDVERLMWEGDFIDYVAALRWLSDP